MAMGDTGLEPQNVSNCNSKNLEEPSKDGAADSGAVGDSSVQIAADLAQVIDAWPNLPESIRRAILLLATTNLNENGGDRT